MIDAQVAEWLNILARWVHVIAGIMWVGNSMLFNWLDRNLEKPSADTPDKFGLAWLLHSGGFYRVEKLMLSAAEMPAVLHWFKWQSYTTWITGFLLMIVVYYNDGGNFLIQAGTSSLTPLQALGLGLVTIFGGFFAYDLVWRSPLGRKCATISGVVSIAVLCGVIYGLCEVFTGRSAYMHVGALLGTFMAGNVFFHIIPSQKQLIASINAGHGFNQELADRAKQRSIHNNYFTFPLIFTMICNHFGGVYGHEFNWLLLIIIFSTCALVRHFMNIRFTFKAWIPCTAATLAVATIAIAWIVRPPEASATAVAAGDEQPVSFAEARAIINHRCLSCHSAYPTDKVLSLATGGVHYDTPEEIRHQGERIYFRAVETKTMPFNNQSGMTDEERATLGRWIKQGMKIP